MGNEVRREPTPPIAPERAPAVRAPEARGPPSVAGPLASFFVGLCFGCAVLVPATFPRVKFKCGASHASRVLRAEREREAAALEVLEAIEAHEGRAWPLARFRSAPGCATCGPR